MKKNALIYSGIVIVGLILIGVIAYIVLPYKIELKGNKEVTINYGDNYIEEGATLKKGIITVNKSIKIEGNVDTKKIGTYNVTYTIYNERVTRVVKVVDTKAPEITLKGDKELTLCVNVDNYTEPGYEVKDNYDEKVENIKVENNIDTKKLGEYEVKYKVCDSGNNCNEAVRKVIVKDTQAPKVTVNKGDLTLKLSEKYVEYGVSSKDNYDSNLNAPKIENNVDNTKEGNYTVKYTVCDSANNCTTVTRKVAVKKETVFSGSFKSIPDDPENVATYLNLNGNTKRAKIGINYCEGIATEQGSYYVKNNKIYITLDKNSGLDEKTVIIKIIDNNTLKMVNVEMCSPKPGEIYKRK